MKCSLPVRNTQILVSAVHKTAISRKLSPLVHFVYSLSIAWIFGIINQINQKTHRKMKSTNFSVQPTPSKTHGDYPRKRRWGKDGPILSFPTKCRGQATYDLDVEAISFANGQGCRSS